MSQVSITEHAKKVAELADQFQQRGYRVVVEPSRKDLPFDLGGYQPDLVAERADDRAIVEVKTGRGQTGVDKLQEAVEEVKKHPGWRFLFVSGEDVTPTAEVEELQILRWEQIARRIETAKRLLASGEAEASFLMSWRTLESALRRRGADVALPIERLPTSAVIKNLYSLGEIDAAQYGLGLQLLETRNRLVHGYASERIDQAASELMTLVSTLATNWEHT